jgi:transaldolase
MAIYLDSAQLDDVRQARQLGFVAAVTTNPTLIAQTGRPGLDVLRDILEMTAGPVFYQVTGTTVARRREQGWEAHQVAPGRVVVKIPVTTENMPLAAELAAGGVTCALTAVASPAQAYLATQVSARYIAPYVSRLTRDLGDGVAIVRDMARLVAGTPTEILAASLKTVDETVAALLAGAHHVTLPLDLILALGEHELSQQAIAQFNASLQEA